MKILAAAFLLATSLAASGHYDPKAVPVGAYGGDHLAVTVRADGADFEFDCATGHIRTPLVLDRHGRFRAAGTYQVETPARMSAQATSHDEGNPVTYFGKLEADELQITVTLPGSDRPSIFHVTRDREPNLTKCM